jgi:hypothetical protein
VRAIGAVGDGGGEEGDDIVITRRLQQSASPSSYGWRSLPGFPAAAEDAERSTLYSSSGPQSVMAKSVKLNRSGLPLVSTISTP